MNLLKRRLNPYAFLFGALFLPLIQVNLYTGLVPKWFCAVELAFILLLYIWQQRMPSSITWFLLLFVAIMVYSTYHTGKPLAYAIYYSVQLAAFLLLMDLFFQIDPMMVLNTIQYLMGLLILLNLFFQLVKPDYFGVSPTSGNYYNLLVSDNELPYYMVPYMLVVAVNSFARHGRLTLWNFAIITLAYGSVVVSWTATGVVGGVVAYLSIVTVALLKYPRFHKRLFFWLVLLYIVVFVSIVVFRVQEWFPYLVEKILKKDLTFSGRTGIWDEAFRIIRQHLWLGQGTIAGGRLTVIPFDITSGTLVSAHSYFLEITMQAGLLGVSCFVAVWFLIGKRFTAYHTTSNRILLVASLCFFAMLVLYTTEGWLYHTFQYTIYYLLFACAAPVYCVVPIPNQAATNFNQIRR